MDERSGITPVSTPAALTIVVVEDEPLLCMVAVDVLAEEGFVTIEAGSAVEALKICETQAIDVLFTDIRMPGTMDGLELAHKVHERWPGIVILLASGILLRREEMPEGAKFVPKPYDLHSVVGTIRDLVVKSKLLT
jgi:CheY-like chemotaxis protein